MYDVLIIGAGPGGGSAALHAARAGLSTLIVEADPEVGTPVHCGECLSELAVENLDLEIKNPKPNSNKRVFNVFFCPFLTE